MPASSNERPPSTPSVWAYRKILVPPKAPMGTTSEGRRITQLHERNRRKPLTITVTYRGGPEAWWELRARGTVLRRPGHFALHDVLSAFDGTSRKPPKA